jgi:quercetin dioxygenase-like cupin family protein
MIHNLEVDFLHEDDRGKLVQLVHSGYEQVNILFSKKNVCRGGHYHKVCKEAFYIVYGSVEVTTKQGDKVQKQLFTEGDFFSIEPNVVHSMYFPKDCLMVQMYSICVEMSDGTKDIYVE